ncbi:MAG: DinB family protein [Phycisphaerae bacterium]|nr:DinB family protein [Phycisphaerae bacterium]
MSESERLRRLHEFDRWGNRLALASIKSCEGVLLSQASRIGAAVDDVYERYARALAVMGHILWAQRRWLWRMGECEPPPEVMPVKEWPVSRLEQEATDLDGLWARFLEGITDEDLAEPVRYLGSDGQAYQDTVADIVTHVLMHGTYHRGQVAMLVKQCGGRPAETDFIYFAHEAAAATEKGRHDEP